MLQNYKTNSMNCDLNHYWEYEGDYCVITISDGLLRSLCQLTKVS